MVLLVGATAHADSVTFTGSYSGNAVLTIKDTALGTVTGYIDPYTGTIGGQSVLLWRVDPDHDAPPVGMMYTANITPAGNLAGMNNTSQVINNKLSSVRREYALWGTGLPHHVDGAVWQLSATDRKIQGAIWQLSAGVSNLSFPDPPAVPSGTQGDVTWYEDQAESNPLTSGFEVVTAANEGYCTGPAHIRNTL